MYTFLNDEVKAELLSKHLENDIPDHCKECGKFETHNDYDIFYSHCNSTGLELPEYWKECPQVIKQFKKHKIPPKCILCHDLEYEVVKKKFVLSCEIHNCKEYKRWGK